VNHRAWLAAAVLIAWGGAEAAAQDSMIALKARRWQAEIEGTIQVDDDSLSGSEIDFEDTFGVTDEEDINELHLTLGFLGRLNLQYLKGKFEGSETLTADIRFGDIVFTVGNRVDAEVELEAYTAIWQIGGRIPLFKGMDLGVGGIVGAKYFEIFASARDQFGNEEEVDLQAPFPVIGAYAGLNFSRFATLEFQAHGIKVPSSLDLGGEGLFFDATIALDVKVGFVFAGVGYRIMHLDLDYDEGGDSEAHADFEIKGLFFEAGIAF
jgi:hypothetical protein